jgi:hypothetical protein
MAKPKYTLYKYVKLSGGKWRYPTQDSARCIEQCVLSSVDAVC